MAGSESSTGKAETGIVLGFLEEAESWQLQSAQFPSKVGGKPAWLSQLDLPSPKQIECETCHQPLAFLLQVYAPIVGQDRSFHRTLFVFCCKTPTCYSHNDSRCFKVFRSQLPRRNDFYPYDPPPDESTGENENDSDVLQSGVKLCRVCGCLGPKSCSRCHIANYCSKEHQVIDWKAGHKSECSSNGASNPAGSVGQGFLFPEYELVTEPEELPEKEQPRGADEAQTNLDCSSSAADVLQEEELEEMAMHETEENKVFQKFKERTAPEPHQVLRYCRRGPPLWVSAKGIPNAEVIPCCPCGAKRIFEFQVMPQLLNHLKVDSPQASIDWGTLAVYTCEDSCDQGHRYSPEFIWKQDFTGEQPSL
ncbi:programmed cell death protein 2 [Megalops cyprinoides]|uniref:programmed cell death protein 2 n=1 Tax=Megalops cyprinoides TaxID=118141 RepID=UPI001864D14D|nr:programmed cell death protein 2 [Megalops cyprinoides]